jgi:branched-chain amino acid transport system permease protein
VADSPTVLDTRDGDEVDGDAGGRTRETTASTTSMVDDPRVRRAATAVAGALAFYWVTKRLWPAPIGVYGQGMVIGGLTALIAFGLALVYRANRIINFAAGDLGGVPAALSVLLILGPGVNYFLAVPIGLVAALALGGLVEFVFIRRFFKAPRLILTVATIAVSQILAGVATVLPRAFGLSRPPTDFPSPFHLTFSIGSVVFRGNEVLAMLTVPVVIAGLTYLLRYTNIGIAIRASAEGADRAALLGVPVKWVQTIVWVVATVLGFVAIFLRAGIVGLPIGSVLGPTILIRALTAAVLGRMEKLPTIFVASLALGIIESTIIFATGEPDLADGILFVIVLAALLLQRRGAVSRVDDDQSSSWQAAREVRPIPAELAGVPEVKWGVRALLGIFALFLVAFPAIATDAQTNLGGVILIFVIVGLSLVVLTGWAGQVSLGQIAFLGIGAAVAAYLSNTRGWDLSLAILGAGLAGAVAAVLIGLPALRIRGLFLAVTTLALAVALDKYVINVNNFPSILPSGVERPLLWERIELTDGYNMYVFCLAFLGLSILAAQGVRKARAGRVIIATRDNQRAADAAAVPTTNVKLAAFLVAGVISGVAGGLHVVIVSGAAGAIISLVVGLPALRIKGLFLAVTTLAFAVALDQYVLNFNNFPSLIPTDVGRPMLLERFDLSQGHTMYLTCLVFLGLAILAAQGLRKARAGRVMIATRDNQRAADAAAVPTTNVKLAAFLVAGVISGVLLFQYLNSVTALGDVRLLLTGAGLLFVLMVFPGGIGQLMYNLRDRWLRRVAARREILVPSLVADKRSDGATRASNEVGLLQGALSDDSPPSPSPDGPSSPARGAADDRDELETAGAL